VEQLFLVFRFRDLSLTCQVQELGQEVMVRVSGVHLQLAELEFCIIKSIWVLKDAFKVAEHLICSLEAVDCLSANSGSKVVSSSASHTVLNICHMHSFIWIVVFICKQFVLHL